MLDDYKVNRRDVLKYGGVSIAGVGLAGCLRGSGSGDYPSEPIRIIVPFSEGGSTDVYARQFQPHLSEELDTDFQIENISGAASLRGAQEAYTAEPDGYTYLMVNPPSTPLSTLVNESDIEFGEFKGVCNYETTSILIMANPDLEIQDFDDLTTRYADGELTDWAGQTVGSYYHIASLYLRNNYDVAFDEYIGYEGNGPATESVVSGETPAGISSSGATEGFTSDGQLDIVALLGSVGTPAYPDTPTLEDLGHGTEMDFLGNLTRSFVAPPETSDEHIEAFASAVEATLQKDEVQQWAEDTGANLRFESGEETDTVIKEVLETVPEELDLEAIRDEVN